MSVPKTANCLLLSPQDNVVVACEDTNVGDRIEVERDMIIVQERVTLGHKIARRNVRAGENIQKYAAPIGCAIRDIAAGEHVHTHNMKSNYLYSHTSRDGGKESE